MPHPASFLSLLTHRRTLLLQGPMGPFFARLAAYLEHCGQRVYKVNFNGGDRFFFRGDRALDFTGRIEAWPEWLRRLLILKRIEAVVLFGQTRPVHEVARRIAAQLELPVYVFEEGYLRPDYVTLEIGGVNGCSRVPKDPAAFPDVGSARLPEPVPTYQRFRLMLLQASAYFTAASLLARRYPHQVHHRPLNPLPEGLRWLRGGCRKLINGWRQRELLPQLTSPAMSKRWFLLPLQVHNDSQIVHHSRYPCMDEVIEEVVASFAAHADPEHLLVIKHHPMDRAYRDYTEVIRVAARACDVAHRVLYVHDLHLPTLLKHARGVITVNSTTGLQSLFHRTPVTTLGDCFYAIEGLVHMGPLNHFWREPGQVDEELFRRFRHYLVRQNQLNASFYGRTPAFDSTPLHLAHAPGTDEGASSLISQPFPLADVPAAAVPVSSVAVSLQVPGDEEPHANDGALPPAAAASSSAPQPWSRNNPARLQ
ncbi:capsule biosynthesis protein [Caldimonas brevitalea]|uniref:Capsular polysaccharide export system protein KpsS n=1 Tax=Caldimonas brevitalea TaxID=413882 RepID=A0A0G3BHK8_9BURK|nr:capsular biosynthesis protein [Caldimonas brevitalea]AKJ26836.1 capsular polysaccharide export system protein KpsS [Caldimonas brevitalea]